MDMIGFIAFIDVVTVPAFFRYYLLLLVFFLVKSGNTDLD